MDLQSILRMYHKNATKAMLWTGTGVTFEEFLRYVTDQLRNRNWMDEHWNTYVDLCSPCQVQYDYIGKIESQNSETNALLHIIGADAVIPKFPEAYNNTGDTYGHLREIYKTVPQSVIDQVKLQYKDDFQLFSYDTNEVTGNSDAIKSVL